MASDGGKLPNSTQNEAFRFTKKLTEHQVKSINRPQSYKPFCAFMITRLSAGRRRHFPHTVACCG